MRFISLLLSIASFAAAAGVGAEEPSLEALLVWISDSSVEERRAALHALSRRLHYHPETRRQAETILPVLKTQGLASTDADARQFAYDALALLQAEAALPLLIQGLAHEDPAVRAYSAQGLRRLGKVAEPAVPALLRLVGEPGDADDAIEALGHIQGRAAVGAIVEAYPALDRDERQAAHRVFAAHPDPAALPIMTVTLRREADVFAGLYFVGLDRPESEEQMRWALRTLRVPRPEEGDGVSANSGIVEVRELAAAYLGRKANPQDLPLILQAMSDHSLRVRVAATQAGGAFRDPRSLEPLAARLDERGSAGAAREDVAPLHRAAIASLAALDTEEARAVLYRALVAPVPDDDHGRPADDLRRRRQQLAAFWSDRSALEQFDWFFRRFRQAPESSDLMAAILSRGLSRFRQEYVLTGRAASDAADAFFTDVEAPHVIRQPAPTDNGQHIIEPTLESFRHGVAIYHANFRSTSRHGMGHGYEDVYLQHDRGWERIGRAYGWVE